jgi:hypothetical protein
MFGKSLAWQSLCFALTAFVPTHPPAFDFCSFVDPYFSHNIESIVPMGGQIKRKKGGYLVQNSAKMET